MNQNRHLGKVVLAGAGPGDPELITVKALSYLREADVIVTDRLVSEELLKEAKSGARIIRVGKEGGEDRSTPQHFINELLVELARENKLIIRLKGGDLSFFSNVFDELRALVSNGIEYVLIPGITAASGASAYSGIPLTARGYATGVRFLTYQGSVEWEETIWEDLASTDDTLVFYMSTSKLTPLIQRLRANRISQDKLIAVIEQATTPFQQVHIFDIGEEVFTREGKFKTPSLVIIGSVVDLHREFGWIPNGADHAYFKSVNDDSVNQMVRA